MTSPSEKIKADLLAQNEVQKQQATMIDILRNMQRIENKLDKVLGK